MRHKLRTADGRVYKMRKAIVEPVFGPIKEQRSFRRFSLRGKQNVRREWKLVCAVSLLKLFRASGFWKWHKTARKRPLTRHCKGSLLNAIETISACKPQFETSSANRRISLGKTLCPTDS